MIYLGHRSVKLATSMAAGLWYVIPVAAYNCLMLLHKSCSCTYSFSTFSCKGSAVGDLGQACLHVFSSQG